MTLPSDSARQSATYRLARSALVLLFGIVLAAPVVVLAITVFIASAGAPIFLALPVLMLFIPAVALRENRSLVSTITLAEDGMDAQTIVGWRRQLAWSEVAALQWTSGPIRSSRTLAIVPSDGSASLRLWANGMTEPEQLFADIRASLPGIRETGQAWSREAACAQARQSWEGIPAILLAAVAFISGLGACTIGSDSPVPPLADLVPVNGTIQSISFGGTAPPT